MLSFPVLYESYSRLYASCIDLHYACRKDQIRQYLEVPPKVAQSTQPDTQLYTIHNQSLFFFLSLN